jgi:putative hydrolase of the HAD superfamily
VDPKRSLKTLSPTTADEVNRVKPHPDLYFHALARTGVSADRALAVEDSPNGTHAAKTARLFCVAVPGPMTRGLDFSAADLVVDSLADRSLESVVSSIR